MTPHPDRHNKSEKPEMLSAVLVRNRIQSDERNVHNIGHAHMFRKDNFLGKDN